MTWQTPPLGSLVETIVPARDKPSDLTGPIPWVRIEDFDGKYLSNSKSGQGVTDATVRSMPLRVFPRGTVVCSCSCTMGTTAIVARPLVTNQTFIGLHPRSERLSSEFLFYALQGHRDRLTATATGAIQSYLSREDFRMLRMPIPDPATQESIAAYLDRETAHVDSLIAAKERMIELLEEQRTVRLNAIWESLDHRVPLKRLIANEKDALIAGPFGSDLAGSDLQDEGPCAVFDQEVVINEAFENPRNYVDSDKAKELKRFIVRPEDVLVTGRGTIGKAVVAPKDSGLGIMHPCLLRVRVNRHRILPDFLVAYLRWSTRAENTLHLESSATTIEVVYSGTLRNLAVPEINVDEQVTLLATISEIVGKVDTVTQSLKDQIVLLKERRQALITAAVTGQLDIPEAA